MFFQNSLFLLLLCTIVSEEALGQVMEQTYSEQMEQASGNEQEIDILNPNLQLLAHYVKLYTDSVRQAHGLDAQSYDRTLYLAANDHAQYVLQSASLSHIQSEHMDKRKPQDRAVFYGGEFSYISENLAQASLFNMLENTKVIGSNFQRVLWSYERTAQFIVEAWVNSPGHYLNLINEFSTHTAIAIQMDETDGSFYVVQLFSKPIRALKVDAEYFPYQHLKLKPLDFDFLPAEKINDRLDTYGRYARKVKINRGLLSTNFKTARKLFKWHKRKSGLLLERQNDANYEEELAVALGGSKRANGLDYFNTKEELAIARKDLFQQARRNLSRKKDFVSLLGIKLPFVKGRAKFQYKLPLANFSDILLTDGHYPYFLIGSISIPGGNFQLKYSAFDFVPERYEVYEAPVSSCSFARAYTLYFEPNAIIAKDFNITFKQFANVLSDPRNVLDTVLLIATASVEGYPEDNKKLFYKRARSIYDSLPSIYKGKKPALKVRTSENWRMMAEQLKAAPSYEKLISESQDSVRSFMTVNRFDEPFKSWLDEQRYARLELKVTTFDTLVLNLAAVEVLYKEALLEFMTKAKAKVKIDSLLVLQSAYLHFYDRRADRTRTFYRVPKEARLAPLRYREVKYLLSRGRMDEKIAFEECSEMASMVKKGERYLFKALHMQLMVNLSLMGVSSNQAAPDIYFLDQFYKIYYGIKAYDKWKYMATDYLYQTTLNRFYRELIIKHEAGLSGIALNYHWGNYHLRALENEARNAWMISNVHLKHLSAFKRLYVNKLDPLSTGEAFKIGLFFNSYYEYDWALEMFDHIPAKDYYGPQAKKVSASIYLATTKTKPVDVLQDLYQKIGTEEWCEFMRNENYYNYRKHLDYKTRKLYCEVCL